MSDAGKGRGLEHMVNKSIDVAGGLVGKAEAAFTEDPGSFAESVAISDMYEIESAQIAKRRSSSQEVREAADRMLKDHGESTQKLKEAVAHAKVTALPTSLDSRRQSMIDHLENVADDKFDKTYLDQQRLAHEEAVTLMHHFRDKGNDPTLRRFASEVSPVIENHLEHMKNLQAA